MGNVKLTDGDTFPTHLVRDDLRERWCLICCLSLYHVAFAVVIDIVALILWLNDELPVETEQPLAIVAVKYKKPSQISLTTQSVTRVVCLVSYLLS